jgi:hypothetical protein
VINAKEQQDIATLDVPNVFIQANMDKLVNMKIEYLNEYHKSDMSGHLGVSYGVGPIGVSVEGELRYVDEEIKQSVRITVRAIQKGGDPKQLLKIIPNNIITCTLDDYQPCFDLFVRASDYARDEFGSQLNSLSDYNVVRYTAKPYSNSTLDVRQLDPSEQTISVGTTFRTVWLENAFSESIANEHRANTVIKEYAGWVDNTQMATVESIKQAAYDNGLTYNKYATHCRDNPYGTSCQSTWDAYLANCGTGSYPACIVNYSVGDLNISSEDVSKYFKCETAREAAANFGAESVETSEAIREMSLAPVFADATDPAGGVITWLPCKLALPSYGTAFD